MDVFDAARIGARRWYVLLPILVLTALASLYVYDSVKVEYSASNSVGVTGPSTVANPRSTAASISSNALLSNGGTTLLANLMAIRLQSAVTQQSVRAAGGDAGYSATVLSRSTVDQLPIVSVAVSGSSRRSVANTLALVERATNTALAGVQASAGVPTQYFAKAYVVQAAQAPSASYPNRTRGVAIVAVAGVIVAFVASAFVDALIRRRRTRKPLDSTVDSVDVGAHAA